MLFLIFISGLVCGGVMASPLDDIPRPGKQGELKAAIDQSVREHRVRDGDPVDNFQKWFNKSAIGGNKIEMLGTGEETHRARLEIIGAAKSSIYMIAFHLGDDQVGWSIVEKLCEKARSNVDVRLILDSFGSRDIYKHRNYLRNCGISIIFFNPLIWGLERAPYVLHEKILISDGRAIIVGGSGYTNYYYEARRDGHVWHDLDFRIDGPVACSMHNLFMAIWPQYRKFDNHNQNDVRLIAGASPRSKKMEQYLYGSEELRSCEPRVVGNSKVVPIYNNPMFSKKRPIRAAYWFAAGAARQSIKLYAPYLVTDPDFRDLLRTAVGRGVEVSLLTNSAESNDLSNYFNAAFFRGANSILDSGATVSVWQKPCTMHRKGGVFDNKWAYFGTDNLDRRGQDYSSEITIFTDDQSVVKQMSEEIDTDFKLGELLTREQIKKQKFDWFTRIISRIEEKFM